MLMSTLYLDRKDLMVKLDGHTMALYENDNKRGTVPFHLLSKIVVRGNIQLESRLLCALSEHKVDVLFLSGRNSAHRTMAFSHTHNDVKRKLAQLAMFFDKEGMFELSRQLVIAKITKQQQFLQRAMDKRADLRKPLYTALMSLEIIYNKLDALDKTNSTTAQLRGFEGSAAAQYFSAYTRLFAPSLEFNHRKRRPPTDPVNACLSLGYTLLHFEAVSACHMAGLDPLVGVYHEPAIGRESLACDLIEPLRPRLDALVWSLFRDRLLRKEHFSFEQGRCLLNKTGRKIFYAEYEIFVHPVRRLLRINGHQLARYYLQSEWNSVL